MPKPTQKSSQKQTEAPKYELSQFYSTVETYANVLKAECINDVPVELPNDDDVVNKFFEKVRDGYCEFSRVREFMGVVLRDVGEVMRRLALYRAKAVACQDVEQDPSGDNLVDSPEDNTEDNTDDKTEEVVVETKSEKPIKKKSKNTAEEEQQTEPPKEEKKEDKKEDKKKKDKKKVESDAEEEQQPEPPKEEKKEDKKEDKNGDKKYE